MADSERHVVVPQLTNLPHIWDSTCVAQPRARWRATTTWRTLDLLFSLRQFFVTTCRKREEKNFDELMLKLSILNKR